MAYEQGKDGAIVEHVGARRRHLGWADIESGRGPGKPGSRNRENYINISVMSSIKGGCLLRGEILGNW